MRIDLLCTGAVLSVALSGCGAANQQRSALPSDVPNGSEPVADAVHSSNSAIRSRAASGYAVLHHFQGYPSDGSLPEGPLLDVNGTLYGTTDGGGAHYFGTVYSVTPGGTENLVYSFGASATDGADPLGNLTYLDGVLYGVTLIDGATGHGAVFGVTPSGSEQVLYSFAGPPDGSDPEGGLTDVNGTLYGTTFYGGMNNGASGNGTVYSISPAGAEQVIYSFAGGPADGSLPATKFLYVGGTFYGTTSSGGANGGGTVFSISPSGTEEKVIYSFPSGKHGASANPSSLIDVDGTFYGTTAGGGANGLGTVFSISPTLVESIVYSFRGQPDGANPAAGLTDISGTLYGVTYDGGADNKGTVFSVTPTGTEQVLHSFAGDKDGAHPGARLIDVDGTLYGTTTAAGGAESGTVFELQP